MERTFVLFKPDALQRGLVSELMARLERKGLKLVGCKMMRLDDKILDVHYAHLKAKPFFPRLKEYMKSAPVVATAWEGFEAVKVVRDLAGVTNGRLALPGTMRGDYSMGMQNLVHASDSIETANAEVKRFFKDIELMAWERTSDEWIYAEDEK